MSQYVLGQKWLLCTREIHGKCGQWFAGVDACPICPAPDTKGKLVVVNVDRQSGTITFAADTEE